MAKKLRVITLVRTAEVSELLRLAPDGGRRACRLGRKVQGRNDALRPDKGKVVFLRRLAAGKEDEDKLVRDKEMACMKGGLAWHEGRKEVRGRMIPDSWARCSWAPDSLALE
jgi:hypothetical protein